MDIQEEIKAIEDRLKLAGEPISNFCKRANIDRSLWTRWKSGETTPNLRSWGKVTDAIQDEQAA